jgi:hypothetical protein
MDLKEQLAAAEAELAKAQSILSPDDIDEIVQREKLAELRQQTAAEKERARNLDVDRRLDKARAELGDVAVEAVVIDGFPDTFIVQRDGKAHGRWERRQREARTKMAQQNVTIDTAQFDRTYALETIYDWNGEVGGADPEFTEKLSRYLTANPGLVTPITNTAAKLAGVFAQERKS